MRGVLTAIALAAMSASCATRTEPSADRAAACGSSSERVYFNDDSEDLPPDAQPILLHVVRSIDQCRAAGGELDRVSIVAFPDRGETGDSADQLADARAVKVKDAITVAGAPANKIEIIDFRARREDPDRVMRRHATIRVEQH
ncbi:MAG: hypothetical protein ABW199_10465 [Caulobacterales bacterium]